MVEQERAASKSPPFETEPLLRRILGIEVSPTYHAWARGGCGTHSNSWRSNTARFTIHVQSRTMRGRVQCMHACMQGGWIDCGRWENIESRLACVIVLKVLGEWEKCFSLVWNLLTVETETSRWKSSGLRVWEVCGRNTYGRGWMEKVFLQWYILKVQARMWFSSGFESMRFQDLFNTSFRFSH